MEYLIAAIGLGALCGSWVLLQRWIARMDPEIGERPPCSGGCSSKLRHINEQEEG